MRAVLVFLLCVFSGSANNQLESRLERQMKSWQKRMGLDQWDLKLRVVRQTEIDPDAWGSADWDPVAHTGVIRVLDPRDYNLKGAELRTDMECTIVHELVHIQVSPLAAHDRQQREQVVNKIMAALMNRPCPN